MFFLIFLRFIMGYIKFEVFGDFPERLLNICQRKGIALWNIRRKGSVIEGCMLAKDFKKMHRLRAKSGVKLKIKRKIGIPFRVRLYRKRSGLAIGLIIFFTIQIIMSSFLWNIEVSGNENVKTDEIINALSEIGINEGIQIKDIDPYDARVKLMLKVDGLAWAAINIEGTKATVDITEMAIVPKGKETEPCNLKASADGVIIALEVTEGKTLVKLGQTVAKGDILVSGVLAYANGYSAFKHASGEVYAETIKSISAFEPFEKEVTAKTGKIKKRSVFNIFGINIPLYLGTIDGEYQKVKEESRFGTEAAYLPIKLTTATFYETEERLIKMTPERAAENAKKTIAKIIKKDFKDINIISSKEILEETDKGVKITLTCVCKENIAREEILLLSTVN